MGNTSVKPQHRSRYKKQVHWRAADRPSSPGKPQLVSGTDTTPDVVTIQWNPPKYDGGSPISGYLVEHRRHGSPHWVRATPILVKFTELSLSGLEPGWRYQFRVSAENSVGISEPGELSELLTVTFQKSASTAPRFIDEFCDTVALENSKLEFTAKFVGQPSCNISWFKDGFEIFSSRRIRIITESDKSVLTIHQTSLSDEGEIKCTATNRAGHASTKANLSVEAPPRIRLPKQYEDGLLFEIGEAIRLKVTIAGRPSPVVFWFHDNVPINENDRISIETTDKYSYLRIEDAQRSDRGEYQIKAINKLSESTASFLVTVTDKPSPPGQARVIMTLGRSVTISWNLPVDDGGCKIGNYIVEYYRIGWDVWLKAATSRILSTTIGDLIEGSEYKFRIKAESPYGVSEPSDESDTIFIPDPKRGLLTRSGNQASDKLEENHINKIQAQFHESTIPIRPARSKIKSPTLTPKSSPMSIRKEMNKNVDKRIFDSTSMDRDLAYGTPDMKTRYEDLQKSFETADHFKSSAIENNLEKYLNDLSFFESRTSTPGITTPNSTALTKNISKVFDVKATTFNITKSNPISLENNSQESLIRFNDKIGRLMSKEKDFEKDFENENEIKNIDSPLNNRNDELSNSSEFMLVLLPEEKNGRESHHRIFDFDDNLIPPPMSLSAPELGSELELFEPLRMAVSSTELLHVRTMARFYEELTSEGYQPLQDLQNNDEDNSNGKNDIKVPKIQINSQDIKAIIGLERRNSYKRRSSNGSVIIPQPNWVDRRHSLKTIDPVEISQTKLHKFPISLNNNNNNQLISDNSVKDNIPKSKSNSLSVSDKRELYNKRQRSESEEREEEEFEKVRLKMAHLNKSERKELNVIKLEDWDDVSDQEKLLYNENDIASDDESYDSRENDKRYYGKNVTDGNNSSNLKLLHKRNHSVLSKDEPFEILTKPNRLPDPAFVPKPILKQPSCKKPIENINKTIANPNNYKQQKLLKSNSSETKINNNLLKKNVPLFSQKNISETIQNKSSDMKQRESSPTVQPRSTYAFNFKETDRTFNTPPQLPTNSNTKRKKVDEEIKVVVDHYGDIVQSYGQKKKSIPRVYLNTDDLKAAAENDSDEIDDLIENYSASNSPEILEDLPAPTVKRKRSFTEVSSDFLKVVKDKVAAAFSNPESADDIMSPEEELLLMSNNQRRGSAQMKRRPSRSKQDISKSAKKASNLKSNAHGENWSNLRTPSPNPMGRKSSPTPMRRNSLILPSSPQSRKGSGGGSGSGSGFNFPKPKMRETTTQTARFPDGYSPDPKKDVLFYASRQEALTAKAEVKVRSTIDYITDLAMFVVACWLYLFQNELLAIPVLLIMVYRQLKEEIKKWLPVWLTGKKKSKRK